MHDGARRDREHHMSDAANILGGEVTYSYRAGKRIALRKEPNQYIVRALPQKLAQAGITDAEQVSSGSSRVTTRPADLERSMSAARFLAPTHHAYRDAATGHEFLITD